MHVPGCEISGMGPVQKRIRGSERLGWSVKREILERGNRYAALTLYAPTLHAPDASQGSLLE